MKKYITIVVFLMISTIALAQPNTSLYFKNMGIFKANTGDTKAAIDNFSKAIALDSLYADAYNNRANVYITLKQFDEALNDFNKAIHINPNDPFYYYNRALAKIKMGKPRTAIEDYDKVVELAPNDPESFMKRGNLKLDLENFTGAVNDFNSAIAIQPKADYYYQRALAKLNSDTYTNGYLDMIEAASLGHKIAKETLIQDMLMNLPLDELSGLLMRASFKIKSEHYQQAISDLDLIIKKHDLPQAYYLRALCNIKIGKSNKACSDLEKAAANGIKNANEEIQKNCKK